MLNTFLLMTEILSRVKKARKEKVASFNARTGIPGGRRELEFLLWEKGLCVCSASILPFNEHSVPNHLHESSQS